MMGLRGSDPEDWRLLKNPAAYLGVKQAQRIAQSFPELDSQWSKWDITGLTGCGCRDGFIPGEPL